MAIPHAIILFLSIGMWSVGFGCAFLEDRSRPDWVDGISHEFPPETYLLGRGEADTRAVAEQRAYAAVARIFHAHVQAQMQDNEIYSQVDQGNHKKASRQLTLDHLTQVSTEKVLADVKVLEAWSRPDDARHFILAGLHRAKTERLLRAHIAKYDQAIQRNMEDGRTGIDVITKLRGLKRALRDMHLRQIVNADLQIVSLTGEEVPALYSLASIQRALDAYLLNDVHIDVQVTGDQQLQLSQAIWDGLTREGLVTREAGQLASRTDHSQQPIDASHQKRPDFLITGTSRLEDLKLNDPLFKYVRWCSDIQVIESDGQRVIGAVSRSGREGHITQHEARVRATQAMQEAVSTEIAQSLARFMYDEQTKGLASPTSSSCLPFK
ncbi:LPP20 family lipoprotein [Nitrospira sp. M1]